MDRKDVYKMPIMIKAMEIMKLVEGLNSYFQEKDLDENSPLKFQLDMI
jgi:hypothetical protein